MIPRKDRQVNMVQQTNQRWNLVAPKGHVLVEGLYFESAYKAEEWCKAYISSWTTWNYRVIIKKGVKNEQTNY